MVELSPAEDRVLRAFARGAEADFREDSDDGASWGPERTVRAEFLRWLLLTGKAEDGVVPALRVAGARISGKLDLAGADVPCPVRFHACHFDQLLDVEAARTRQLDLNASVLPGLRGARVRMAGALHLTACRVTGDVRLAGARIAGPLLAEHARLEATEGRALRLDTAHIENDLWAPGLKAIGPVTMEGAAIDGALNLRDAELSSPGDVCLDGTNLGVGSGVLASRLATVGEVRLTGARVGGTLDITEATLTSAGGKALRADNVVVGADLRATRVSARGCVDLRGGKITGRLDLAHAELSNDDGVLALRVSSGSAAELSLREAKPIRGLVSLQNARFDLLTAPPEVWPEVVKLNGLRYGALAPHLPARERLPLLKRNEDGFVPESYTQLAAAYSSVGDDVSAREVGLARQRHQRGTRPRYARIWGYLQDVTVGYGYRPLRAAAWLALLLAVGTLVFGFHHPPALDAGKAPVFNPFVYTLDLLLPIVDFGQAKAVNPHGGYQWLSYALVAAGWLLATTVVAGITRTINRR
ncbi:hypothetical protein ACFWY9_15610 [Amycolatopsis sp. NPDC059027]|uniref:hypothetical protein n=1 Tax=Amycolatopsis sp. NPDC059027 TaxID=3346709 RepID=UPI0036711E5E